MGLVTRKSEVEKMQRVCKCVRACSRTRAVGGGVVIVLLER